MISLDVRKDIFIRRFIQFQSYRGISSDLNINRGTVTNICNDIVKKIKELGLNDEVDLISHMSEVVIEPKYQGKRKSHKVNPATKRIIISMVESNEIKRTRKLSEVKTVRELYEEFKTKEKLNNEGNKIIRTDITYNNFYKIVVKIKKEILQKNIEKK
jgi:hypothetical protein